MRIRETLAWGKFLYQRGSSWISIILGFASIATMVKVYEDFFRIQMGMSIQAVLAIVIPFYLVICVIIGYADYKIGIMKDESNVGYYTSPVANRMSQEISEILKIVKR